MGTTTDEQDKVMEDSPHPIDPEDDRPGHGVVVLFTVFVEAGLAPFSIVVGWMLGHLPLQSFSWNGRDALIGAVAALPLFLLFLSMLRWPVGPLCRLKDLCELEVVPLFRESLWSELALISLSAGVGEEMLFRGVFQATFMEWFGTLWGVVLAGLLFGLLHPMSVTYIAIAGLLGLYLGAIWIYNGNLLTVMVTHALYDFIALAYLIRLRSEATTRTEVIDDRD